MNGGGDQILSALDEQLFKQSVEEKANDINCISIYVGCDESIINSFFDLHSNLMNRNPLLIFNMDETMVSSKKKFKVLCGKQQHGLVMSDKVFPHMTACITIGVCGHVMKPLFILPNKKKIDGLEEFEMDAYFASSISGWMNKRLFTY